MSILIWFSCTSHYTKAQTLVTLARHLESSKVGVVLEIRPEKTCLAVVAFGRNFLHFNFIGDEVEHFEVKLTQI
jgi:hypothetical protein